MTTITMLTDRGSSSGQNQSKDLLNKGAGTGQTYFNSRTSVEDADKFFTALGNKASTKAFTCKKIETSSSSISHQKYGKNLQEIASPCFLYAHTTEEFANLGVFIIFEPIDAVRWRHRYHSHKSLEAIPNKSKSHFGPSLSELQDAVCSAFGISFEDLAKACQTTQNAVYNWRRENSDPRARAIRRLFTLYRAARDWIEAGFPIPDKAQLHQPVIGNRTLYILLCEEVIDLEAIEFAGVSLMMDSLPKEPLEDPFA